MIGLMQLNIFSTKADSFHICAGSEGRNPWSKEAANPFDRKVPLVELAGSRPVLH